MNNAWGYEEDHDPQDRLALRIPPHDAEAEQALLGAMMLDCGPMASAIEDIPDEFFYSPANQQVFTAMRELVRTQKVVDPVALRERLDSSGVLSAIGGPAYLLQLMDTVPSALHWEYYHELVEAAWVRRRVMRACADVIAECQDTARAEGQTPREAAEELKGDMLARLLEIRLGAGRAKTVGTTALIASAMDYVDAAATHKLPPCLETGLYDLDRYLPSGGMMRRWVYVVGGRTSMGKTSFCETIVRNVLRHGAKVLFFTLESGALQAGLNLLGQEARIPGTTLLRGHLTEEHWSSLIDAVGQFAEQKLFVNESTRLTPEAILAEARTVALQAHGLDLVVVDYLQRIHTKGRSREEEVAKASDCISVLARELDVPVLAAAQLNRGPAERKDHTPVITDLRYSGEIEQDADVVMLLHRPAYYDEDADPTLAQVILAKNRNGVVGTIELRWDGPTKRFDSLSYPSDDSASGDRPVTDYPPAPEAPPDQTPDNRAGRD